MKLLLAIDDSACSDVAIKAVEERPWPKGSEARIISVIDPPLSPTPQLMRVTNNQVDDLVQAVQLHYEAILKTAARRLNNGRSGPIRVTEVVKQGHASEEIIKEAEAWGADIIVIGSHGRRLQPIMARVGFPDGLESRSLFSRNCQMSGGTGMKVLIATDGSEQATTAMRTAARVLCKEGNQFDLLCVAPRLTLKKRGSDKTKEEIRKMHADYQGKITEEAKRYSNCRKSSCPAKESKPELFLRLDLRQM
ncbi:MAG: universal stress protein [Acidobacteria bacterium]|nr:universal stress protein [Acidobacteriota bacterium]